MSDSTIARRYAGALIGEARREGVTDQVDADIAILGESLEGSRDLVLFFGSPVISRKRKDSAVAALFAERIHPVTLKFLRLLIRKRREQLIMSVVTSYKDLRDAELGVVEASARVMHPLEELAEKNLIASLEHISDKRIRLKTEIDPDLMGGIVVRVGDTVYDGSVLNQLNALRERMENGSCETN